MNTPQTFIIMDAGGTYLRSAIFDSKNNKMSPVRKNEICNFIKYPDLSKEELKKVLLDQFKKEICHHKTTSKITGIGLSFAGPVDTYGRIKAAPTILGKTEGTWELKNILEKEFQLPVFIINDLSAAAWKYSEKEKEPFCVITISSGIGNKIFYHNKILTSENGNGGEIGHWKCDLSPEAPFCDCGEQGHLGAIASGRGIERLYQKKTQNYSITTFDIVEKIKGNDPLAINVLQETLIPLAQAICNIYCSIGIERFVFIGGVAQSLGDIYLFHLKEELKRQKLFGLTPEKVDSLLTIDQSAEDCLEGMAVFLKNFFVLNAK